MSALTPADLEAAQKRTVATLVVAQAVGAVGITIGIATASLLARDLSGSEEQAGLAQTFQVLGAAVSAYLLARLMSARGRRVGLATGYLVAAAGSLLAVVAGVVGSMLVLLVGAALVGAGTAANSGARYAATDLATEDRRARALSTVVWATTIGAVAGAEPVRAGRELRGGGGHPGADRAVRARRGRHAAGGDRGRRAAAPGPAAAGPRGGRAGGRRRRTPRPRPHRCTRRRGGAPWPRSGPDRCSGGRCSGSPAAMPRWSA